MNGQDFAVEFENGKYIVSPGNRKINNEHWNLLKYSSSSRQYPRL